jgi:Immunity protein 35
MLTMEQAREIVVKRLREMVPGEDLVVVDAETITKSYGFVFFYNSRAYLETRDPLEMLGGNGPAIVLHDGSSHFLGTVQSAELALATFERERGLHG